MHIAAPIVWCVIPIGVCTNEKTCKGLVQLVNAYHILLQFKLLVSYAYLPKINKEIFQENLLEFVCVLTHFWRTTLFCCITWKVQSCLSFLLCFSSHDGFVSKCKCLVRFPCPFPIFLRGAHGVFISKAWWKSEWCVPGTPTARRFLKPEMRLESRRSFEGYSLKPDGLWNDIFLLHTYTLHERAEVEIHA